MHLERPSSAARCAIALLLILATSCASTPGDNATQSDDNATQRTAAPPPAPFEMMKISERAFSFRHHEHMNLVLNTAEGWVVMDPMNETAAAELARRMKQLAPKKPLVLIAYSHYHQDHAGGARGLLDVFGDDVSIVANKATPALYAGKDWAKPIVTPTELFEPPWSRTFGDITLELRSLGPNHSSDMIIGWVPEEKLVYLVDFVGNKSVGYRDLPGASLPQYWDSQRAVLEIPFEHVAYGHGRPGDRAAVLEHIDFWNDVRQSARDALNNKRSEDQAVEQASLDKDLNKYREWSMYKEWFPLNVRAAYRYEKSVLKTSVTP